MKYEIKDAQIKGVKIEGTVIELKSLDEALEENPELQLRRVQDARDLDSNQAMTDTKVWYKLLNDLGSGDAKIVLQSSKVSEIIPKLWGITTTAITHGLFEKSDKPDYDWKVTQPHKGAEYFVVEG